MEENIRVGHEEDAVPLEERQGDEQIRVFDTGATRDTLSNKLSYVKALSPIALRCYVEYIGKHRVQSDGTLRDWDNWKLGIVKDIYLDSGFRHTMAIWLLLDGCEVQDEKGKPVNLEESLCGIIFNAIGMLHEILKEKQNE